MRRENPGFESSEFSFTAPSLSAGQLQEGGFRAVITHWGADYSPPQPSPLISSLFKRTVTMGHQH